MEERGRDGKERQLGNVEETKIVLKEWKTVIETQMHFNEMIIRARIQNVGSGLGYCDLVSSIKKLADFPGETFCVLKEKEEKQYGEYRNRRLVLEAWDRLHGREA